MLDMDPDKNLVTVDLYQHRHSRAKFAAANIGKLFVHMLLGHERVAELAPQTHIITRQFTMQQMHRDGELLPQPLSRLDRGILALNGIRRTSFPTLIYRANWTEYYGSRPEHEPELPGVYERQLLGSLPICDIDQESRVTLEELWNIDLSPEAYADRKARATILHIA